MRTSTVAWVIASLILTASPAWAEGGMLKLSEGTLQLGGDLAFTTQVRIPEAGSTTTGFVFSFTPSAGYFVADNFELLAGLQFTIPFGDLYETSSKAFGFQVGGRYHANLARRVSLYGGLSFGVGYTWLEYRYVGMDDTELMVSLQGGLLVALSEAVAVNAGVRFTIDHYFDAGVTYLTFPVGVLGVEAFF
ncbi:MAG: outer membrane beta-barrel protein [Myxococcales bacterium]